MIEQRVDRFFAWLHDLLVPLTSRMSLAVRVAILSTGAVAATLAVVSTVVFITVRAEFISSLDESMFRRADAAVEAGYPSGLSNQESQLLELMGIQLVNVPSGSGLAFTDGADSQYDIEEREVALGHVSRSARTTEIYDIPYRVVAVQAGPGQAIMLGQSMESTQKALDRLLLVLLLASTGGMALAWLAGWVVASNGLRPVRRLTEATEYVALTGDLTPIKFNGTGRDELARLTSSFNVMLQALDAAQLRERQLVADAGHELRTPLTSLRTNIELLRQATADPQRSLSLISQRELMDDVWAQLDELTTLIQDLVELARDEPLYRDPEPLNLADIVEQSVERVRLRAPTVDFDVDVDRSLLVGESQSLERAVTNLLDNAAKWSPDHAVINVRLREGVLTITDHGPGISEQDLPFVFDRFYRATEARTQPGSGLGLSIVRRAAERHGGSVTVDSTPGNGATFTLSLPLAHAGVRGHTPRHQNFVPSQASLNAVSETGENL